MKMSESKFRVTYNLYVSIDEAQKIEWYQKLNNLKSVNLAMRKLINDYLPGPKENKTSEEKKEEGFDIAPPVAQ